MKDGLLVGSKDWTFLSGATDSVKGGTVGSSTDLVME